MNAAEQPHSMSTASLALPGVCQVTNPEIWKSLKFLRNPWTLVYFSAHAGGWKAARRLLCPSLSERPRVLRRTNEVKDGFKYRKRRVSEWMKLCKWWWKEGELEVGEWDWEEGTGRDRGRHPLLDPRQRIRQMNAEVSFTRTGWGLEMDGFTQTAGKITERKDKGGHWRPRETRSGQEKDTHRKSDLYNNRFLVQIFFQHLCFLCYLCF